jgi:hypothetical protein
MIASRRDEFAAQLSATGVRLNLNSINEFAVILRGSPHSREPRRMEAGASGDP